MADTIVPDPNNPQAFNHYSYVHNQPLNFTDTTGHCDDQRQCANWANNAKVTYQLTIDFNATPIMPPPTPAPATPFPALFPPPTPAPAIPTPQSDAPATASSQSSPIDTGWWPDYVTGQVSWLIFQGSVTVDTYSNAYVNFGITIGAETPTIMGLSGRLSAGYISAEINETGPAPLVALRPYAPSEAELENHLTGWGWNAGGGYGGGLDVSIPLNNSTHKTVGFEPGIYSPQLGVGVTHNILFWDATDNGYNFSIWE